MTERFVSANEAKPSSTQHTKPCGDCPWSRKAIPGWLGSMTADEWLRAAHGESLIDCHARRGPQCAGSAIYRANMAKLCRDREILRLPSDRKDVFATPTEFRQHHEKGAR